MSVSTSHCTVYRFCVNMSTAVFYSLSNVCQYLTMYRLLFLCYYVHCCLLESVLILSLLTLYSLLVLCHCVHYDHLHSVKCLSVPHALPSVHCLSVPHTVKLVQCLSLPYILPSVGSVSVAHCCLLLSVHCLSVTYTVESVDSLSLFPLHSSTVCPLPVSTVLCTLCPMSVSTSHSRVDCLPGPYTVQSLYCPSVPHTYTLSIVITSHCNYSLSTSRQYVTL
jgi:hypothetical protein